MTSPTQHTRGQHTPRTTTTMAALLAVAALACAAFAGARPAAPAKRTATHGGVRITFDVTLAREATAKTVPASPLEAADEKPDGVYPEHVAFTLVGMRGAPANSYHEPVVRVSAVAEYLRAFSVSPRHVRDAERTLNELRRLLRRRRPAALKGNVPMLPFPDATEVFHARVRYLRFSGGSGVAFLTQGQQDTELINSQHTSYEFRGLTDDGRFYVSAVFPVAAPPIAASRDAAPHYGYTPELVIDDARARRRYDAYVEGVRRRLERLRPEQFGPDLRLYDELLSSIEIRK
ncbi:MAG: hypothetical protein ABW250_06820 [Pyrinomonadaceae bacterium]